MICKFRFLENSTQPVITSTNILIFLRGTFLLIFY